MLVLDGYTISKCISSTHHSEVFSGVRDADGLAVVLKIYRSVDQPERARRRAEREFRLLERVRVPGVVRAVALERLGDDRVLVVERFDGLPLSVWREQNPIDTATFLKVAVQLAASLAGVHEARVVHKDVKLDNVLIDPATLETCIIDFGIAAEFGSAQRKGEEERAEGTLRYLAPEQTGRIGLGVDFRTDLYSLGATLYELSTGLPLYDTTDALELIHAQIAAVPVAPAERCDATDGTVSRLIMKLLEKDPERRYQTAWGLHADLTALTRELDARGGLPSGFELATQDVSDRLQFPSTLYGREKETTELRHALARASAGGTELVLLSGPAGIGKTSLLRALRPQVIQAGGYLAVGSFDPDRPDQPYVGFAAAFSSLIDQILAESSARLDAWKQQLSVGLGRVARALVDVVPSLEYLVADAPPIASLGPKEARERLALGAVRFVRVFATRERPLVLFFDGLRWADAGSRFLLDALLRGSGASHLLVVATLREDDLPDSHPVRSLRSQLAQRIPVRTLELRPLSGEALRALLSDVLHCPAEELSWLADCVERKTLSNPLLVQRFLERLWERRLLRFEHGVGWTWQRREVEEVEISDDAASILIEKIGALPDGPRDLLRAASVVGVAFDVELLGDVAGGDRSELLQTLAELTRQGLVSPCREGFGFVHDRVRSAAQALVPHREQEELHHRAAFALLVRTPPDQLDERLLDVVDHLNRALALVAPEQRIRVIELNLRAGMRSLAAGAAVTATRYLATARALLAQDDFETHGALVVELHLQSAEAAYQERDFDGALRLLSVLDARALSTEALSRATAQRIQIFTLHRSNEEAVGEALAGLRRFGVRLPREPGRLRICVDRWRTDWALRGSRLETGLLPARNPSEERLGLGRVLTAAGIPLAHRSVRLNFLSSAYLMRIYRTSGWMRSPALLVAAYGCVRLGIMRSPMGIERYRKAVLSWIERLPDERYNVQALYLVHAWMDAWTGPRRSVLEPLRRVADELREAGDLVFRSNCLHTRACYLALVGEPISQVRSAFEELASAGNRNFADFYAKKLSSLAILSGEAAADFEIEGALRQLEFDLQRQPAISVSEAVRWVASLCFLGMWRRAFEFAQTVEPFVLDVLSMSTHVADYEFFRGMAAAAVTRASWRGRVSHTAAVLRKSRHLLAHWSARSPDFVHMLHALDAEFLRLRGQTDRAIALYDRAAERARTQGYIQHAALVRERRSDLLRSNGRTPLFERDLQQAFVLYKTWGAGTKVQQLERRLRAR